MDVNEAIALRDKDSIWHPFTHLSGSSSIPIVKGEGALLFDANGKAYIDAISSWWVNLHGHSHPYIAQKVSEQLSTLEHVLFAGFTHEQAIKLSERLLKAAGSPFSKVFFSDDGSTSVEVALKMAFQYWHLVKEPRKVIVALKDAYHGDTFGAMSTGSRGIFSAPFQDLLFEVKHLSPDAEGLSEFEAFSKNNKIAAFIYEPLVQGAGGMKMYEPHVLSEFLRLCQSHEIVTIADEVMTGFQRTGKMFASDHLENKPDLLCLSKGLTGGTMPMGVTLVSDRVATAFLVADRKSIFFHGHSFTGNPLACAAANASFDLLEQAATLQKITSIVQSQRTFKERLKNHPKAINPRVMGTILAVDLKTQGDASYTSSLRDRLYDFFVKSGVILRPLGNVMYVLPPYCITKDQLERVYGTIVQALEEFS